MLPYVHISDLRVQGSVLVPLKGLCDEFLSNACRGTCPLHTSQLLYNIFQVRRTYHYGFTLSPLNPNMNQLCISISSTVC